MIGSLDINHCGKTAQRPLVSVYDYFPFGMLMPGRFISDTSDHCMTISRSNWSTEMADTCKPLVTLASTGIFSAGSSISTSGSSIVLHAEEYDSWIQLTTEVEVGIGNSFSFDVPVLEGAAESGMQVMIIETRDNIPYVIGGGYLMPGGRKQTINFNASGNTVNLLFNGPFSTAEIEQICTHYSKTTQQTYLVEVCDESKDKYRFGFNGQEKVNEIAGVGNHNTAEFWEYDTRLGRRWNLDPKPNLSISTYAAFGGNPIMFRDVNGDTVRTSTEGYGYIKGAMDEITRNKEGNTINPIGYDSENGVLTYDQSVNVSSLSSTQKKILESFKGLITSSTTEVNLQIVDMDDKIFNEKRSLRDKAAMGATVLMGWTFNKVEEFTDSKGNVVSSKKTGYNSVYETKKISSYAARNPEGIPTNQHKVETEITVIHELLGHAFKKMGYSNIWMNNKVGKQQREAERKSENTYTESLEGTIRMLYSDQNVKQRKVEKHP